MSTTRLDHFWKSKILVPPVSLPSFVCRKKNQKWCSPDDTIWPIKLDSVGGPHSKHYPTYNREVKSDTNGHWDFWWTRHSNTAIERCLHRNCSMHDRRSNITLTMWSACEREATIDNHTQQIVADVAECSIPYHRWILHDFKIFPHLNLIDS